MQEVSMSTQVMRTTLNLPVTLVTEAMQLTHSKTKTEAVKIALENLVRLEKIQGLKDYAGKIDLGIDIDAMRKR
jgi:Arc/MetJ family transcription regulator